MPRIQELINEVVRKVYYETDGLGPSERQYIRGPLVRSGHACPDVEWAIEEALREGRITETDDEELRMADGEGRPKHPNEL